MPSLYDPPAPVSPPRRWPTVVVTVAAAVLAAGAGVWWWGSSPSPGPVVTGEPVRVSLLLDGWSTAIVDGVVAVAPANQSDVDGAWQQVELTALSAGELADVPADVLQSAAARMLTTDASLSCSPDGCAADGVGQWPREELADLPSVPGLGQVYGGWSVQSLVYRATVDLPPGTSAVAVAPAGVGAPPRWAQVQVPVAEAPLALASAFGRVVPLETPWVGVDEPASFEFPAEVVRDTSQAGQTRNAVVAEVSDTPGDSMTTELPDDFFIEQVDPDTSGVPITNPDASGPGPSDVPDAAAGSSPGTRPDGSGSGDVPSGAEVPVATSGPSVSDAPDLLPEPSDAATVPEVGVVDPVAPVDAADVVLMAQGLSTPVPATVSLTASQVVWYSSPAAGCDVGVVCAPTLPGARVDVSSVPVVLSTTATSGVVKRAGVVSREFVQGNLPAPIAQFGMGDPVAPETSGVRSRPISVVPAGEFATEFVLLRLWGPQGLLLIDGTVDGSVVQLGPSVRWDSVAPEVTYGPVTWSISPTAIP